jgi:DNA-binding beta-propeller fold protein YncE
MRRSILLILSLSLVAVRPVDAGTFNRTSIAPAFGLDALTRAVARERVGRDLFSAPYATVTIENVDVYDVFPYVESRTFQVVSDPRWNRLVYGEPGRSLKAYDGAGRPLGPLSDPHGLAVDDANRVYVADTGNDRVLVLSATTEFDEMVLTPLFEIRGLSRPYDVAVSDGGTPFAPNDDRLYVADTGMNQIVSFALGASGARIASTLGSLGSGPGRFAGPMAIAVGRDAGANTRDVYVADAHTRRIVQLRDEPNGLRWVAEAHHDANVVTSLSTDHWGNLYATAPERGGVRKFGPDLTPVAELRDALDRPTSFHVPFVTVRDHRSGSVTRSGRPSGLSVDRWSDATGMRLWDFGVEVQSLAVVAGDAPTARFTLTDRANVTLDVSEVGSGRSVSHRALGVMPAGGHTFPLRDEDTHGQGELMLRLSAVSSYPDGKMASAQTRFASAPGGPATTLPSRPILIGNTPNPVRVDTRISFVLPAGGERAVLEVLDPAGRRVRLLGSGFSPGLNEVVWNGTNDRGTSVAAGIYFYRLRMDRLDFTRKMVVVR